MFENISKSIIFFKTIFLFTFLTMQNARENWREIQNIFLSSYLQFIFSGGVIELNLK